MALSSDVEPGGLYVPRRRMLTLVASMISCCVDFFVSAALFGQSLISMSSMHCDEPAPPPPLSASFIFFSASAAAACVAVRTSGVAPPGDGATWAPGSSTLSPQRFRFRFGSSLPVTATSVGASAPVSRDARKASVVAAAPASPIASGVFYRSAGGRGGRHLQGTYLSRTAHTKPTSCTRRVRGRSRARRRRGRGAGAAGGGTPAY